MPKETPYRLLGPDDPPAVTVERLDGRSALFMTCDHAGREIPRRLGDLGVPEAELARHIAWDIGALGVARRLSEHLDAALVSQTYSRLVIDCNRRLNDPTSIAQESDRIPVPGNKGLREADRTARAVAIFHPYHQAITTAIERKRHHGPDPVLLSLHSFTPQMNGFVRPWHIGILWNRDPRLPVPLMARLTQEPGIVVGDNEPYSGRDEHGYSVIAHGEALNLPHGLIEVRQDLISDDAGVEKWSEILIRVLKDVLADDGVYRPNV